jgi:hypothetical protein
MTWLLVGLTACKAPPDAPSGLDDSVKFLFRDFYGDDATIGAGLTGLLDWFEADGGELLDARADLGSVGAFSLTPLSTDVVAAVEVEGDPDPATASGVVSVSEMACAWEEAEALLVRPDQDRVFEGDFDRYDRRYLTNRAAFEAATDAGEFDAQRDALDPSDLTDVEPGSLLLTENAAASTELGVTVPFDLVLHFRHGRYEIQGEDAEAFLILGYFPHEAVSDGGDTRMVQNYSIEVNVARGKKTLRVFANWTELDSSILASDSPLVLTSAVNKSQDSAARVSNLCAGEESIE